MSKKFDLVSSKAFYFYFRYKTLSRNWEKIKKTSYYLLIISNLILNFLIAIYFILNIYFSISSLKN